MTFADLLIILAKIIGVFLIAVLMFAPITAWLERKQSAVLQDRVGPSRANVGGVALFGLVHVAADALKFFFKENFMPARANRFMHSLAPLLSLSPVLIAFAVIPFGESICIGGSRVIVDGVAMCETTPGVREAAISLRIADLDAGLLFIFAIASISVYGAAMGGWASNNKFALLGGLRATLQMFSYEIVLGLSAVSLIMVYGSVDLAEIVRGQGEGGYLWGVIPAWGIIVQPIAAILFLTAGIAETKRVPFDTPEGESEIVAGYFLEYSSSKFLMFFMGEYLEMILLATIFTMLFLGGWQIPYLLDGDADWLGRWPLVMAAVSAVVASVGYLLYRSGIARSARWEKGLGLLLLGPAALVAVLFVWLFFEGSYLGYGAGWTATFIALSQVVVVVAKMLTMILFQMFVRWTVPRFRYDQVMLLGWKMMLPVALANIALTAVIMVI